MDLQQAFDSTARVLFGQEIGKLEEFAPYLSEMMQPYQVKKSCLSGKTVMVSLSLYPADARFISQDEIGKLKFAPLSVNEIKDIDSLFEAVGERVVYCGNKLFGRNQNVTEVDNCVDSVGIFHSNNVYNVKFGAYLSFLRDSENVFGVSGFPQSRNTMRSFWGVGLNRCFECYFSTKLSEVYYGFNCIGCQSCMFAFNLRGKRFCIGNLELEKGRYLALKDKLTREMGDKLRADKRLFSIVDIALAGSDGKNPQWIAQENRVPPKVEEAFGKTTRLLLGKELHPSEKYAQWLLERAVKVRKVRGALGGPAYKLEGLPQVAQIPADRLVPLSEQAKSAESRIEIGEGESPGLDEIFSRVSKKALLCFEFEDGANEDCVDVAEKFGGAHNYRLVDCTNGKYSGFGTSSINSEYIFGGYLRILNSQFCINCFDSTGLARCFEVDSSYTCKDSYLCHNCENVENAILCFNVKAMRYAVGNTEVGKEEYERIKKMLCGHMASELEARGKLGFDIFSIPKGKKSGKGT
jgi:hypothetical protein